MIETLDSINSKSNDIQNYIYLDKKEKNYRTSNQIWLCFCIPVIIHQSVRFYLYHFMNRKIWKLNKSTILEIPLESAFQCLKDMHDSMVIIIPKFIIVKGVCSNNKAKTSPVIRKDNKSRFSTLYRCWRRESYDGTN